MKKYLSGLLTGIFLSLTFTALATELNILPNPYPVFFNGVRTEVEGYNINGYSFLKLADFKKIGLTIKFNETDEQIEVNSMINDTKQSIQTIENITTKPKVYKVIVNGKEFIPDIPPVDLDEQKYFTIAFVRDVVQAKHFWDSEKNEFTLTKGSKNIIFKESIDLIKANDRYCISLKKAVDFFNGTYSINNDIINITISNQEE